MATDDGTTGIMVGFVAGILGTLLVYTIDRVKRNASIFVSAILAWFVFREFGQGNDTAPALFVACVTAFFAVVVWESGWLTERRALIIGGGAVAALMSLYAVAASNAASRGAQDDP